MATYMKILVTLIGLITAIPAGAQVDYSHAAGTLISELQKANFSNITATERLLGGVVIEAEQDGKAVLIALAGDDYEVEYVEIFQEPSSTGFFGTEQRPLSADIQNVLSRYRTKLAASNSQDSLPDVKDYLTQSPNQSRTAGFSQSRTITANDNGAVTFRSNETLGLLTNRTYTQESITDTNGNVSQTVTERGSVTSSQVTSTIQMNAGNSFSSDVFTNPEGFRSNIQVNTSNQLPVTQSSRTDIINQISDNATEMFSDSPNSNLFNVTNEMRQIIIQNLSNQN